LLVLLLTGFHLMLVNESYEGLGRFFANPWSILIVVKHVLVLTLLGLAAYVERAYLPRISEVQSEAPRRFRWALTINLIQGAVILLLTSIAQAG